MQAGGSGVTQEQWESILANADYKCLKCGQAENLTMDHIVPLSKGGRHEFKNIQPLCLSCNSGKRDREAIDYHIKGGPIVVCVPYLKPHKKFIPHLLEWYAANKRPYQLRLCWQQWRKRCCWRAS